MAVLDVRRDTTMAGKFIFALFFVMLMLGAVRVFEFAYFCETLFFPLVLHFGGGDLGRQ